MSYTFSCSGGRQSLRPDLHSKQLLGHRAVAQEDVLLSTACPEDAVARMNLPENLGGG